MQRLIGYLLASSALVPLALLPVAANPLDPVVVTGHAVVTGEGTANLTVNQSSDKAIIDWRTFNIDLDETTTFVQPTNQSVVLNRVTGGEGASHILGALQANGQVFLVNPGGILFGKDAKVDVGALVATTHDILNEDFLAGNYRFYQSGDRSASIVNLGTITVEDGGFAALVAPGVRNAGTIRANLGKIALASGSAFALDFYGDGLIQFALDDETSGEVIDLETGERLQDLVSNSGELSANGGTVALTASAARAVVNSVINNTGNIEADTVGTRNGKIVLGAATVDSKGVGSPTQTVKVSGTLSASGAEDGEIGGHIEITAEAIELVAATLEAFGWSGGGTVLVGGDVGGGAVDHFSVTEGLVARNDAEVGSASIVRVAASALIDASALHQGEGGKVIVWSDGDTTFSGAIRARGGDVGGDGGFVETSGQARLAFDGTVDAGAAHGEAGTLLLDPLDVTIGTVGTWVITPAAIQAALALNDVVVTTSAGAGNGDITVAESVTWSSANDLALRADRNVAVNAALTNTGGADVELRADKEGTGVGTVAFGTGGVVSTSGNVDIFFNPSVNPAGSGVNLLSYANPIEDFSGSVAGGGTLSPYMLVNSIYDLQNVRNELSANYALGRNIDAASTIDWNGGSGFVPLGHSPGSDAGTSGLQASFTFDGLGHSISGLNINTTHAFSGLFGANYGTIRNLQLLDVTLTNAHPTIIARVGAITGINNGLIEDVYVTGTIEGGAPTFIPNDVLGGIGGIVGHNNSLGVIRRASADVTVSGLVAGAIVGENFGLVTQVAAAGQVLGIVGPRRGAVGGIAGRNIPKTGDQGGTILDSYSRASVVGGENFAGGVAGQLYGADSFLNAAYAAGILTGDRAAGVVWMFDANDQIAHTYWDATVGGNGTLDSFGTGHTTEELKSGLPTGFDPTIWGVDPAINDGYPYLLWQAAAAPQPTVLTPPGVVVPPDPDPDDPDPDDPTPPDPDDPPVTSDDPVVAVVVTPPPYYAPVQPEPEPVRPGLQALIDEIVAAYDSPETMRLIADNAIYAGLADAAYAEPSVGSYPLVAWQVVASVRAARSSDGLSAIMLKSDTGELVLSFRGTDNWRDRLTWLDLATEPMGQISQFQEALSFAREMQELYGNFTVTGHSLGGGMAQYVAAELGLHAVAFDPAPIGPALLRDFNFRALGYDDILKFRNSSDPLTGWLGSFDIGPDPIVVQNTPEVAYFYGDNGKLGWSWPYLPAVAYNHEMSSLATSMSAVALVYDELST